MNEWIDFLSSFSIFWNFNKFRLSATSPIRLHWNGTERRRLYINPPNLEISLPEWILLRNIKLFWYFNSFCTAFFAAAAGHPERLRCEFRFELICPRPLQPNVGHFKIVSFNASNSADNFSFLGQPDKLLNVEWCVKFSFCGRRESMKKWKSEKWCVKIYFWKDSKQVQSKVNIQAYNNIIFIFILCLCWYKKFSPYICTYLPSMMTI